MEAKNQKYFIKNINFTESGLKIKPLFSKTVENSETHLEFYGV
jgi:hypothetical protein